MNGMLVCFEGIDGSGKATQAQLLRKRLEAEGRKCLLLSYPDYESGYGKRIDAYLHHNAKMSVPELFLLFLADMLKDSQIVREAVAKGDVVICDRYFYSTIAYQCAAGFDYDKGKAIEAAAGLCIPSIVFYMDLPARLTYARKMEQKKTADRHERDAQYMEAVGEVYGRLYSERYSGAKWVLIDATKGVEEINGIVAREINIK